jgi:ADP-heptose:LPS heptosyltransferase
MKDPDALIMDVNYDFELSQSSRSGKHFSDGYITDINNKLNVNIVKKSIFPSIYLTTEEELTDVSKKYNLPEKFWIFNAGIKQDIPLKSWVIDYWFDIIDNFNSVNTPLIQIGSNKDIHPNFGENVISLVGKTEDLRDFIVLASNAVGSIGPISLHMHLMAAFKKPCIVIAGGRETPTWEFYPNHQFLHTIGSLECCKNSGCYKKQRYECSFMNKDTNFSECMSLIKSIDIWRGFKKYLGGN